MIINPPFPYGYTTFCDDIRLEASGKQTIVGAYGSDMIIQGEAPVQVQGIWALMRFRDNPAKFPMEVSFRIIKDSKEGSEVLAQRDVEAAGMAPEFEFPEAFDEHSVAFGEVAVGLKLNNLTLDGNCVLRAKAFVGDDEVRLGALNVTIVHHLPDFIG